MTLMVYIWILMIHIKINVTVNIDENPAYGKLDYDDV